MYRSPKTYPKIGAVHAHRVISEQLLGRPLGEDEVVHHRDNNKHNNDPGNLVVFPNSSYHARCHFGEMSEEEVDRYAILNLAAAGRAI